MNANGDRTARDCTPFVIKVRFFDPMHNRWENWKVHSRHPDENERQIEFGKLKESGVKQYKLSIDESEYDAQCAAIFRQNDQSTDESDTAGALKAPVAADPAAGMAQVGTACINGVEYTVRTYWVEL